MQQLICCQTCSCQPSDAPSPALLHERRLGIQQPHSMNYVASSCRGSRLSSYIAQFPSCCASALQARSTISIAWQQKFRLKAMPAQTSRRALSQQREFWRSSCRAAKCVELAGNQIYLYGAQASKQQPRLCQSEGS